MEPLEIPSDPELAGRRCAECGSDRITAAQPGIGGWITAACYGCGIAKDKDRTGVAVLEARRVATYVACPVPAETYIELGERVSRPCLLPLGHEGGHSRTFIALAPKTRGAIRGISQRGSEHSKLPKERAGSFTDLIPGWTEDGPTK